MSQRIALRQLPKHCVGSQCDNCAISKLLPDLSEPCSALPGRMLRLASNAPCDVLLLSVRTTSRRMGDRPTDRPATTLWKCAAVVVRQLLSNRGATRSCCSLWRRRKRQQARRANANLDRLFSLRAIIERTRGRRGGRPGVAKSDVQFDVRSKT